MMKRKWIDLIGSASSVSSFRLNVTSLQKPLLTTSLLFFTRASYFFHSTQPSLNDCFPFSLPKVEALLRQEPCQSYHFCIPYTLHSEEWGTDPKWLGEWMNELLKCYVAPLFCVLSRLTVPWDLLISSIQLRNITWSQHQAYWGSFHSLLFREKKKKKHWNFCSASQVH